MVISKQDIINVKNNINNYIIKTPVLSFELINKICDCEVFFKCENLNEQRWETYIPAKDEVLNDVDYNGYYFCPKENKMLDETNTDLGHDLLKKWGREAKLETTFIQGRKENRKWNKGNFPKPADYLDGVLKTYQHMMSNPQNIEEEVLMKILPCIKVIKKVIEKYEQL